MRFWVACLGAPLVTFCLLLFMAGLINKKVSYHKNRQDKPYFNLVMTKQDESFESRTRKKPIPPEPEQQQIVDSVALMPNQIDNVEMNVNLDLPTIDLTNNMLAMQIALPALHHIQAPAVQGKADRMVMPLYRVEPRYPRKALRLGKQGYVTLSFDINEKGQVNNIVVLEAQPKHLFEREARRALKKWKYKPMLVNGQPKSQLGQKIRLEFKMEKS